MDGTTNLLQGRRGAFDKCKYWVVDNDNLDLSEYTHNTEPSGIFYANELTAKEKRKLVINNSFMFNEELVTLHTKSQITLKEGDLVEYDGDIWIVKNCQSKKVGKNEQFMSRPCKENYIQLKR